MRGVSSHGGHLPTGLPILDGLLSGGLPSGTITEFTGPAGAGKTQFCITLSVIAAENGEGVLYIDTEGSFHARRLHEVASTRNPTLDETAIRNICARVSLIVARTGAELLQRLTQLETLVIEHEARLVIIDSIAAAVRKEYHGARIKERQDMLSKEASLLKTIAEGVGIPIMVTNQITTQHTKEKTAVDLRTTSGAIVAADDPEPSEILTQRARMDRKHIIPALGNTWSHCVTTRVILHSMGASRRLVIAKSPSAPMAELGYCIVKEGVQQDLEGTKLPEAGTDAGHFNDIEMGGAYDHKYDGAEGMEESG